jgi:hypothetical protein
VEPVPDPDHDTVQIYVNQLRIISNLLKFISVKKPSFVLDRSSKPTTLIKRFGKFGPC